MIDLYPRYKSGNGTLQPFLDAFTSVTDKKVLPFSCARAAMVFFLRVYGTTRMEEILVPPFLGGCVLSALTHTIFPSVRPSEKTTVIMVYHQFGFSQKIEAIQEVAKQKGWHILSNCSNTISSRANGVSILDWGDVSIVSFAKLFSTGLGGGLVTASQEVQERYRTATASNEVHGRWAQKALSVIQSAHATDMQTESMRLEIEGVYGYLPEIVAFPDAAAASLPQDQSTLETDFNRRKRLLGIAQDFFPDKIPDCKNTEVVPFAIPIRGNRETLDRISKEIHNTLEYHAPVLHFDFACNMLASQYEPALVLGCHEEWDEENFTRICRLIQNRL